jgi:outer membrane biogenesis lipoprotein LolB
MTQHPRIALLTACLLLTGCGAEVAGSAAAVGGLQTQQLQQARQQQAQVVDGLKAAQAAGMARAASAGD